MQQKDVPTPSIFLSLIPVAVTGIALWFSIFVLDTQPHFALFLGATVAGLCAYVHGCSWETIREGFKHSICRTISALLILLIIGMLIGVWIAAGIMPALMYLGFEFLTVRGFLPLMLLLCSAMSLITGSSWTTIGSMGVAAIGVSEGLGIPLGMTAGAVVSGAFFGDKISPMSDSTNLTASVLGVNLFDHIRHMLYTTIPALLIALVIFTLMGFSVSAGNAVGDVSAYSESIRQHFQLSGWLAVPPAVVILLIVMKVPAIPCLIAGVVLGGVAYLALQGGTFSGLFETIHTGFRIETGDPDTDRLFSRGGMESMYEVISLALVSLALGGIMDRTGMLHSMVLRLSRFVRSAGNLTLTVISTSVFINIVGANQYLAVILPGQMFEECYRDLNLKLKNLTRTLEGGGTLTAPLIPWNSSGVFIASTLGVSAATYAPYAILCWLTAIIVVVYGYAHISMASLPQSQTEPEDQQ